MAMLPQEHRDNYRVLLQGELARHRSNMAQSRKVIKVIKETLDAVDQMAVPDPRGLRDLRAQPDLRDHRDQPVKQALKVYQEPQEP